MRRLAVIGLGLLACCLTGALLCEAGDGGGKKPRRPGAVLYKIRADAAAEDLFVLENVLELRGAKQGKKLDKIGVEHVIVDDAALREEELCAQILATRAVEFAEPDYLVDLVALPNDSYYGSQWFHTRINSPGAWDVTTGSTNIIAGLCDTGVDASHVDLAANLVLPGYNTVDNTTNSADINGHGTATAGCIGAVGNNATGVSGMNWRIRIIPIRISNLSNGSAYYSDMAEGIQYAADRGAKVANLSYLAAGSGTIDSAAQYLRGKGGLLFVAAGNDGQDPGWTDFASFVAVGATDSADAKASWSNYGTFIDVVAPGVSIYTTSRGSAYGSWSGTSFSSPITAGLGALIFAVNPSFTPAQVENFIFSTCVDLGTAGDDSVFGRGRINAAAAVAAARDALGNRAPVAVIHANPASGPAPLAVTFTGTNSYDPDGSVVAYAWAFGDGSTASGATVTHTYSAAGTFTAVLTVTDNAAATSSASGQIVVAPDPSKVVYVAAIDMALATVRNDTRASARVRIVDASGAARAGATVSGRWSGLASGTASGNTGADGTVMFQSQKLRKSGSITFTVTGVSAAGYTYDPSRNVETSDSITR